MGGFSDNYEGGFWDQKGNAKMEEEKTQLLNTPESRSFKPVIETSNDIYSIKAYAKINIFLKITGHKEGYHTLLSRFMRVENLYDTISFVPCPCNTITIEGCEGVPTASNTIYKAYKALIDYTHEEEIEKFFQEYKVTVSKKIPSQAGLGGGSSDAAAFMHLVKEVCNLPINTKELAKVGSTIGADLPFFIYNYPSANVTGFGEIVELFEEAPLPLEIYTPDIGCDTAIVYKTFKQYLLADIQPDSFKGWEHLDSKTILQTIQDPVKLNDLYAAALMAYPELIEVAKEGWFFSGSGSSFFRIKP